MSGRDHEPATDPLVTADSINRHYASVSTDASYEQPPLKHTAAQRPSWIHAADSNRTRQTAGLVSQARSAGPLRGPAADLINTALFTSSVPNHWKQARIRPVPKTPAPQQAADYRPISIAPVRSCIVDRIVVRRYIYPALCRRLHPRYSLLTNSLSGLQAPPLLPSLLSSTQSSTYCHLNSTSSSSHWNSPRLSTLYVTHHSSTNLHSLTFLTISITGWPTFTTRRGAGRGSRGPDPRPRPGRLVRFV